MIHASREACFDASRDIDLHMKSFAHTGEKAIAGKTSGLIGLNETVTWRARHFMISQNFTSKITAFNPPEYFQDTMLKGAFRVFVHDHYFQEQDGKTLMIDLLTFQSPLGILGRIVDTIFLTRYMTRFIQQRCQFIKSTLETK